jgi:thiosulfate/3-mercaptopyruvate sulfurtransferase
VCYDTVGVFSSPRAAYTFKGESAGFCSCMQCLYDLTPKLTQRSALGHEKVSVLDGGLPRWIAEGNEVETGSPEAVAESEYTGATDPTRHAKSEFLIA